MEKILHWFPKWPVTSTTECTNRQQYAHTVLWLHSWIFPYLSIGRKANSDNPDAPTITCNLCSGFYHVFCDAMGDICHPTSHIKVEKIWSTVESATSNLIPISSSASRWPWEIENKPSCWGFTTMCDEPLKQDHFRLFCLVSSSFRSFALFLYVKVTVLSSELCSFCVNVASTVLFFIIIYKEQDSRFFFSTLFWWNHFNTRVLWVVDIAMWLLGVLDDF